jgi:hypothetical protein
MQFHVVPAAKHGPLSEGVYLTENAAVTWEAMQRKMRFVEAIHQWYGTVWLGRADYQLDADGKLPGWGEHGCRIGHFILFGDKRLLKRIREACR